MTNGTPKLELAHCYHPAYGSQGQEMPDELHKERARGPTSARPLPWKASYSHSKGLRTGHGQCP